jgi:hypothetical protein
VAVVFAADEHAARPMAPTATATAAVIRSFTRPSWRLADPQASLHAGNARF